MSRNHWVCHICGARGTIRRQLINPPFCISNLVNREKARESDSQQTMVTQIRDYFCCSSLTRTEARRWLDHMCVWHSDLASTLLCKSQGGFHHSLAAAEPSNVILLSSVSTCSCSPLLLWYLWCHRAFECSGLMFSIPNRQIGTAAWPEAPSFIRWSTPQMWYLRGLSCLVINNQYATLG